MYFLEKHSRKRLSRDVKYILKRISRKSLAVDVIIINFSKD